MRSKFNRDGSEGEHMDRGQSQARPHRIGVFGLGRFGAGLAIRLAELGADVLAVDSDEEKVNEIDQHVSRAVCLNATNEFAVRKLNPQELDLCVVSIGRNIEAGLLATVVLQKCGAKNIMVRAIDQNQAEILQAMGVRRIISLEKEMAQHVAQSIVRPGIQMLTSITADHSLAEVQAKSQFVGKTLAECDFRNAYGVNIVAIKSTEKAEDGEKGEVKVNDLPMGDDVIKEGDVLVVIGADEKIRALQNEF